MADGTEEPHTYVCGEFGKGFLHAAHLSTHQQSYSPTRPTPAVSAGRSLAQYLQVHSGERAFDCGPCCKAYPSERPLAGSDCGRAFSRKDTRAQHCRLATHR